MARRTVRPGEGSMSAWSHWVRWSESHSLLTGTSIIRPTAASHSLQNLIESVIHWSWTKFFSWKQTGLIIGLHRLKDYQTFSIYSCFHFFSFNKIWNSFMLLRLPLVHLFLLLCSRPSYIPHIYFVYPLLFDEGLGCSTFRLRWINLLFTQFFGWTCLYLSSLNL